MLRVLVATAVIVVDTTGFSAMCRDLSRMSGAPMHRVLLFESGKVLESAMRGTRAMSAARIKNVAARSVSKFNNYAGGDRVGAQNVRGQYPRISIAPNAGHSWWLESGAGKPNFYIMKGGDPRRWSAKRWAAYQSLEAERKAAEQFARAQIPLILRSRGVAKASWLQIGDNLGVALQGVPGYVRSAVPRRGPRVDGVGRKIISAERFFIELENHNQILINRLGGARILQRAVDGRLKFFTMNMKKGAFDSIAAAVKKYPGVFLAAA